MLMICLSWGSCKKEQPTYLSDSDTACDNIGVDLDNSYMLLGEKQENPYTISNMEQAAAQLGYPVIPNFESGNSYLEPTDKYIKFFAASIAEIESIEAMGHPIFTHPLDYEISSCGGYYDDPIPYSTPYLGPFYVVLPHNATIPSNGITHEVLDVLYHPSDGEEELEAKAYELAGYPDPILNKMPAKRHPSGVVKFEDNLFGINSMQPARKVRVVAQRFTKIRKVTTDDNGAFTFENSNNAKFRKARIFLSFNNDKCVINFARRFLTFLAPAYKKVSNLTSNITNMDIEVSRNGGISTSSSISKDLWVHLFTTTSVEEFYDYCLEYGLGLPEGKLRIYAHETDRVNSGQGAAPMLNFVPDLEPIAIAHLDWYMERITPASQQITNMPLEIDFNLDALINAGLLPDITISVNSESDNSPSKIKRLIFHELAHAIHQNIVSDAWWSSFRSYIIEEIIASGGEEPYGKGDSPNNHGVLRTALAEGWAYFLAPYLVHQKYYVEVGNDIYIQVHKQHITPI